MLRRGGKASAAVVTAASITTHAAAYPSWSYVLPRYDPSENQVTCLESWPRASLLPPAAQELQGRGARKGGSIPMCSQCSNAPCSIFKKTQRPSFDVARALLGAAASPRCPSSKSISNPVAPIGILMRMSLNAQLQASGRACQALLCHPAGGTKPLFAAAAAFCYI